MVANIVVVGSVLVLGPDKSEIQKIYSFHDEMTNKSCVHLHSVLGRTKHSATIFRQLRTISAWTRFFYYVSD